MEPIAMGLITIGYLGSP